MTMNLTIFTVFASLLIILSRARKSGEELCCTALRSVQKSDFIACIITSAANRLIGEVVQSRRRPLLAGYYRFNI